MIAICAVTVIFLVEATISGDKSTLPNGKQVIAVAGPMSGEAKRIGEEMQTAVRVLVETINQNGGVNGTALGVKVFDDQNNPVQARSVAQEIVKNPNVIGVIGHALSSTSLAAAPIYQEAGIAAISPSATATSLTDDHDVYFSSIYSDVTQGRFLAEYASLALKVKNAVLLVGEGAYPDGLASAFINRATALGINVDSALLVPERVTKDDAIAQNLITRIRETVEEDTLIGLFFQRSQAFAMIQILRDAGIRNQFIGPDSIGSSGFAKNIFSLQKEIDRPGHYSANLFVSVPFMAESASRSGHQLISKLEKRIGKTQSWIAPYAYDAALILSKAATRLSSVMGVEELSRQDVLAGLSDLIKSGVSIEGAMEKFRLGKRGAAVKPTVVGQFQGGLVSSLLQLRLDPNEPDKPAQVKKVIYTAIQPVKLLDVNTFDNEAEVEFDIWFRFQGDFDFSSLIFDHAIEPIVLRNPETDVEIDGIRYRQFTTTGRFRLNVNEVSSSYERQILEIGFHDTSSSDRVVFVPDMLGLPATSGEVFKTFITRNLKEDHGWHLVFAALRGDIGARPTKGNPQLIVDSTGVHQQAGFLFSAEITPKSFALRQLLDFDYVGIIAAVLLIATVIVRIFDKKGRFPEFPRAIFVVFSLLSLISLTAIESTVLREISASGARDMVGPALVLFECLWWLWPTVLVLMSVERFIWTPLETAADHAIPKIVKNFTAFLLMALAVFGIIAFVFDRQLTSLLATSGVIAMIIGLAIQMNISNIFSGIAINIERPFRPGDWVQIGDNTLGKVVDISWRSTKLETFANTLISIPNASVAESAIENFSYPYDHFRIFQVLHFGLEHDPERVTSLLYDALKTVKCVDGRDHLDMMWVKYNGVDEHGQKFLVAFDCTNRMLKNSQEHVVLVSIYKLLARYGIHPTTTHVNMHLGRSSPTFQDQTESPAELFDNVEIFSPLDNDEKTSLAKCVIQHTFRDGEVVVQQDAEGDSLFVIGNGVVSVQLEVEGKDEPLEINRLGVGEAFGEMALLTGDPRTATIRTMGDAVLYEIPKSAIQPILEDSEGLETRLSDILAERILERDESLKNSMDYKEKHEEVSRSLYAKIKGFFSIGRHQEESEAA